MSTTLFHRPIVQAAGLGLGALALALLANAVAPSERRIPWRGFHTPPQALTPPPPTASPSSPVPAPPPVSFLVSPKAPPADPKPADAPVPSPEALKARFPMDPAQPIRELTDAEAWEAWRLGALFLDARRSAEYRAGHIAGARSLPLWEDGLEQRLTDLRDFHVEDPRQVLILYCSGGSCTDSHDLAQRLFALGLPNLRIYRGGYPAWVQQGRPIRRGDRP